MRSLFSRASLLIAVALGCDTTSGAGAALSTPGNQSLPATIGAVDPSLVPPSGQSELEVAVARLQRHASTHRAEPDAWVLLGRAWTRLARTAPWAGYSANADTCARHALELSPEYGAALDLQAVVLLDTHEFARARGIAERVVHARPDDVMGWGNLSDALLNLGDLAGASAAAEEMVSRKPGLASYARASHLDWLEGRVDDALQAARLAIDSGTSLDAEPRAWALVESAMIFWHRGDYEGADAGFALAREHGMADYPPALVGQARVALARGDGRRAVELSRRARERSPSVEVDWLLADALDAAGDEDGSRAVYASIEHAAGRALRDPEDRRTLSLFYSTKNLRRERALSLAEEEMEVRGDVYTLDVYAWALHRAGRDREAKSAILRARSHGTPDALLMFHEGAIRVASGEVVAGRKLIGAALALNPAFDVSAAAEAVELLGPRARRPAPARGAGGL